MKFPGPAGHTIQKAERWGTVFMGDVFRTWGQRRIERDGLVAMVARVAERDGDPAGVLSSFYMEEAGMAFERAQRHEDGASGC